jgi:hypothetical protein
MNSLEQASRIEDMPEFGIEFDMADFDINAAFQEAIVGVATDKELALDEKVRRMELIVNEGASEVYRGFVDFRAMAAQMEMVCNHDHALNQSLQGSETLSGFMDGHKGEDGHDHGSHLHGNHNHKEDDEYEIDPQTGKKTKKKKRHGWLGLLLG